MECEFMKDGWVFIGKIFEGWCIECSSPLIMVIKRTRQIGLTSQGTQRKMCSMNQY